MKYYLATIDGRPAGMADKQICFADKSNRSWYAKLYTDLRSLRKDIKKTIKFREGMGWKDVGDYDYVFVEVPEIKNEVKKKKCKLKK